MSAMLTLNEHENDDSVRRKLEECLRQDGDLDMRISCYLSLTESIVSDVLKALNTMVLSGKRSCRMLRVTQRCNANNKHFHDLFSKSCHYFQEIVFAPDYSQAFGRFWEISESIADALKRGLTRPDSRIAKLSFELVGFSNQGMVCDYLCDGIEEAKSLREIEIEDCNYGNLPGLVKRLVGHDTLESLLLCCMRISPETMMTLEGLLKHPQCKLQRLNLNHPHGATLPSLSNSHRFQCESLRELSVQHSDWDEDDVSKSFLMFPNLETLKMRCCRIENFDFLWQAGGDSLILPNRLRSFSFLGNPVFPSTQATECDEVVRLLMLLPNLQYIGPAYMLDCGGYLDPLVRSYLDWNRCGRSFKKSTGRHAIPAALWPLVLARANTILEKWPCRRANTIYNLCDDLFGMQYSGLLSFGDSNK